MVPKLMVTKPPQSPKADRREAARAQALKLQQEQLRREKRTRITILASVVAGLIVVGLVAFFILQSQEDDFEGAQSIPADVAQPATANTEGGVTFGVDGVAGTTSGDDAVNVDVYLDYMCPICGQFEDTNQQALDELREAGDITLTVHAISILDRVSQGSAYSTRSAQAFAFIADRAPEQALDFNAALFAQQPAEGTAGLTDDQLVSIAESVGVPTDVAAQIPDLTFKQFVQAKTQVALADPDLKNAQGSFGTPTILIDGAPITSNWTVPGNLTAEIQAAKG